MVITERGDSPKVCLRLTISAPGGVLYAAFF